MMMGRQAADGPRKVHKYSWFKKQTTIAKVCVDDVLLL